MSKLIKPSVLAMEKKLVPSNGVMYSCNFNNKDDSKPLKIITKSVRGTISNKLKDSIKDPLKINAEVCKSNLQTVDACSLPVEHDTLKVFFTLKILSNLDSPTACDNPEFLEKYKNLIKYHKDNYSFEELGFRYAYNIANGRFLWRNRVGADKIEIQVKNLTNGKKYIFDAFNYSLRSFPSIADCDSNLKELGNSISQVLSNEVEFINLEINAFVHIGNAQDVYPSEELILDSDKSKKNKKSKILFDFNGIASMHSQKIGNAIRTIDDWYDNSSYPISVEPYGSVTNLNIAFRKPTDKKDFYSLFYKAVNEEMCENKNDSNFIMAMIIRGGVFGDAKEKK
jgi:CRISPR-associated protein Csy3